MTASPHSLAQYLRPEAIGAVVRRAQQETLNVFCKPQIAAEPKQATHLRDLRNGLSKNPSMDSHLGFLRALPTQGFGARVF
jgi:hypothetical protein